MPHVTQRPGGVAARTGRRAPAVRTTTTQVPDFLAQLLESLKGGAQGGVARKTPKTPLVHAGRRIGGLSTRQLEEFIREPGKRGTETQVRKATARLGQKRRQLLRERGHFTERTPVFDASGKRIGFKHTRRRSL